MSVLPDAVCWHEGMQLLPQHFQLQGLRAEALAARTGQACNPWFWGVTALELDPSALCAGQVRVLHLEAILPDGLPVSVQAGVDAPLEFDLETALAAAEGPLLNVHLAVSPLWRAGQLLPLKGRLQSRVGAPLPDLASGEHPEPITVWRASLRLVGDDGKADSVCLPLLRVAKEGGAYVSLPYVPPTPLVLPESPLGRRVQSLCARAREKALFLGGRLRLAQQAGNQDDAVEVRRQLAALWTRLPEVEGLLASRAASPLALHGSLLGLAGAWPGPGRRSIRWPACRPSKRSTSSTCGVATSRCWTGWSAPSSRSARATAACRSSRRNRYFPCACPIRRRASAWWSACGCPPAPANKRRLTGWSAPSSPPTRTCRCSPGNA